MPLDKPILLQDPPYIGKTSMIEAPAHFTGHKLIRINLSGQTDISDFIGSGSPMKERPTTQKKIGEKRC